MATRKIYAVRYKCISYHQGKPFTDEKLKELFDGLVRQVESKRDLIEIATMSLKKAKWYEKEAQEKNGFKLYDNEENAVIKHLRPTYSALIKFYYIDVLPSI